MSAAVVMSKSMFDVCSHALGMHVVQRRIVTYRNYFVTGPGCDDFGTCSACVESGFMEDHGPQPMMRGDHLFTVTTLGASTAREMHPPIPKLSRSQARYQRWLNADCGLTFAEWIKEDVK